MMNTMLNFNAKCCQYYYMYKHYKNTIPFFLVDNGDYRHGLY